jgi:hypothetical protein
MTEEWLASRLMFSNISRCISPIQHANPFVRSLRLPHNDISKRRITYNISIPSSTICQTRACVPDSLLRDICDQGAHDVLLLALRSGWRAGRPGWHPVLPPKRWILQDQRIRRRYMLRPRPQVLRQAEVTDGRVRVPDSLFFWTCHRDGHVYSHWIQWLSNAIFTQWQKDFSLQYYRVHDIYRGSGLWP